MLLEGIPIEPPSPKEVAARKRSLRSILKEGTVFLEDYEKDGLIKSFLVKGDTRRLKDQLKPLGGR